MANPKLTLYVDIVSPFGYLAYYVTRHSPIFRSCDITYIPIYLGGLMKLCNNRPPLEIKNKDKWIATERLRWASLFNIPTVTVMPAGFPPPTLHLQRVLAALQLSSASSSSPESSPPLALALDALYHTFMVDGNPNIGKADTFTPVLEHVLGAELAQRVIAEAGGEEAKKRLTENTEMAFQSGAFGLPWFECVNGKGDREGFWGFDHLAMVVRFLGLGGGEAEGEVLETGFVEGMKAML